MAGFPGRLVRRRVGRRPGTRIHGRLPGPVRRVLVRGRIGRNPDARVHGRRRPGERPQMAILRPRCGGPTAVLRWPYGKREAARGRLGGPSRTCRPTPLRGGSSHYRERVRRWRDARARLRDPAVDRTLLDIWLRERARAFAIETGQIEGLYTLRRGVTGQLIAEGFGGVRAAHALEPGPVGPDLEGLARRPHAAVELVFEAAAGRRPLSHHTMKSWHQLLTRHQEHAAERARRASRADRPAARRLQGVAEQPASAGRRRPRVLPARADAQRDGPAARDAPRTCGPRPAGRGRGGLAAPPLRRIHPFQDGNGRMARLLMAYVFVRAGEFSAGHRDRAARRLHQEPGVGGRRRPAPLRRVPGPTLPRRPPCRRPASRSEC